MIGVLPELGATYALPFCVSDICTSDHDTCLSNSPYTSVATIILSHFYLNLRSAACNSQGTSSTSVSELHFSELDHFSGSVVYDDIEEQADDKQEIVEEKENAQVTVMMHVAVYKV